MMLAPRSWLFLSAAAGLTACASNPPREPVVIDYRAAAPGAVATHRAPVPQVFADTTRPPPAAQPRPIDRKSVV